MLEDGYRICSIDGKLEEYCEQTCGISAEGMMDGEESSEQGRYIVEIAKKNGVAMEQWCEQEQADVNVAKNRSVTKQEEAE